MGGRQKLSSGWPRISGAPHPGGEILPHGYHRGYDFDLDCLNHHPVRPAIENTDNQESLSVAGLKKNKKQLTEDLIELLDTFELNIKIDAIAA